MEDMINTTEVEVMDTVENEEETSMVPCDSTTCEDDESSANLGGLAICGLALVGAGLLIKKGVEVGKKVYGHIKEKKAKDKKPPETTVEVTDVEVEEVTEDTSEKKEDLKK